MSRVSIRKTVNVVNGFGEVFFEANSEGHAVWCQDLAIISPDNTPMYNFDLYNGNGSLLVPAHNIDVQYANVEKRFKLEGLCRAVISSAADPGAYPVEMFVL